ncbi:MAG: insulinase family protein, partial [Bdellovibrionales bacterium]|nr:insulinase family protein [Bdellovibrionales bacterium]
MQPQLEKLTNNLNTLFVHAEGSTSATVQVWFKAGSSLERAEEHGIAHFLEHMFFKGTKKRPGHLLAKEIESFGGEINAFTSFDYTCYYINCPNDKIKDSCDALMDMISNPTFKQAELVPERGVVLEEYKRMIDSPNQYSFYKIQKKFLGGKYSHPILGRVKTINNFTQTQLKQFRNNYYNNQNSLLVVAGDLNDKPNIKKQIEKYKLPNGKESIFPKLSIKNQNKIQVFHNDVTMCELTMIIPSPVYEDDSAPNEEIAMGCLGHGETSLLYKELVIKTGLCHSAYASTLFVENGGIHLIRINCPYHNLEKSMVLLSKVLLKTINSGVSTEDIGKIKNQYVASKVFEKESIESYAFSLGHSYTSTKDIFSEDLFINKIKNSKESDVLKSFKDILSRPIQISVQIPNKENLKTTEKGVQSWFSNLRSQTLTINKKKIQNIISNNKSKFDPNAQIVSILPGVKLLYRHNSLTPTFSMQAYIKGGLTDETKDSNGIYSQLSSLLTYGHKKKPYQKLRMYLEETCSSLNGFAGKNAYGISMKGLSDNFNELSSHFFNSMITPTIPDKYLALEKKMAIRSLKSQVEDPVKQCFNTICEITFKNHPYSMNIIGSEQSLKKLTTKKIKDLHNKNLREKEILISYCGDLDLQTVQSQITPFLS